jgi:hypothetical protein
MAWWMRKMGRRSVCTAGESGKSESRWICGALGRKEAPREYCPACKDLTKEALDWWKEYLESLSGIQTDEIKIV